MAKRLRDVKDVTGRNGLLMSKIIGGLLVHYRHFGSCWESAASDRTLANLRLMIKEERIGPKLIDEDGV